MIAWRRSSFCSDTACVEVMRLGDVVMVRDSKEPERDSFRFTEAEWRAFIQGVRAGEFE